MANVSLKGTVLYNLTVSVVLLVKILISLKWLCSCRDAVVKQLSN